MDDTQLMQKALRLAAQGCGTVSPNPMVGAVIVKNDHVVGQGFHRAAGQAHAEVAAIQDAGVDTQGATLYVTLEPCNHFGRTPPCTEAILSAGIKRVVVAMKDPNPTVTGGGIERLKSHGVQVDTGICAQEARRLNEAFVKFVRTKQPFVTLKCAATLDGRIATKTGDSKWISGERSRAYVHHLRHAADAILVGIGTVRCDDPSLTTRLTDNKGVDPRRIVLDTHLSISENAKMLQLESKADTIVIAGPSVPQSKRALLEQKRATIYELPADHNGIDLQALMNLLGQLAITSLLIEGGSRVIASALTSGIVDKVIFFYGPKITGGDDGVPICKGPGPASIRECIPVGHVSVQQLGDDAVVEGYIDQRKDGSTLQR